MHKILFISLALFLTFPLVEANAQSHTFAKPYSACRFSKDGKISKGSYRNNLEGFAVCPACDAEEKKELEAKVKEDKRIEAVRAEKVRQEKIAKDIRDRKQNEEDRKKNPVKEVFVKAPVVTAKTQNPSVKPVEKVLPNQKSYFYTEGNQVDSQDITEMDEPYRSNRFKNQNYFIVDGKKLFTNNEFRTCIGSLLTNRKPEENNFPPNLGIVILHETSSDEHDQKIQITDLVNAKGERTFKDEYISIIIHFIDDYFIVFSGKPRKSYGNNYVRFLSGGKDAFIYNYKTKAKHPITRYYINGKDLGYEVDYVVNLNKYQFIEQGKYKARFRASNGTKYLSYYITNDGKIEEKFDNR